MKKTLIALFIAFAACSLQANAMVSDVTAEQTAKPKKAKSEIKDVTFKVHIHCAGCLTKIKENLAYEKGVKDLHICMEDQVIQMKYDAAKTNEETLKKAIVKLGVEVHGTLEGGHHHNH